MIPETGPTFVRMAEEQGRAVSLYFAFRLHDHALSRRLGLPHKGYERDHFKRFGSSSLELGGNPVVSSMEESRLEEAVSFLLKAQ